MADRTAHSGPPPGFEELLRRAAVEPDGPLDVADVGRRVRRIRRNRRLGSAALALALLAPASIAGRAFLIPETSVGFLSPGGGRGVVTTPTDEPSDRSTVASTPTAQPSVRPEPVTPGAGLTTPVPGSSPSPSASPGVRTSESEDRQSSATVVISDPPGAPERRPDLPGDQRHPRIILTLVLDKAEVRQGEQWSGWLEARNTGDEPVALGDADCWALWGLYAEDAWVGGQRGSVCGQEHPKPTLAPGATVRVPLTFDTVAGDKRGKDQAQLEAGRYTAAAGLRVATPDHEHNGVWYATATVTVAERSAGS